MTTPTVFISYSHQDEKWKDKLVKHLGVLEQEGLLALWDDRRIVTGTGWLPAIEKAMTSARVAVLLVSADFLTSQFIRRQEVPRLLERREKEGMRVIPVIVSACIWPKVGWLASIQAALGGKPLASLKGSKVDEALTALAAEILEAHDQVGAGTEESFLATYRRCLSAAYSHWDLAHAGVAQAGGAGAPIEAKLDDMYLPLRLAEGFDLGKTDRGQPISPADLLSRERPLVIRGAAGSGKTTWMRWTFRRLLEMEGAFPMMLVLRDLARSWQDPQCKGAKRSLDAFLEEWVAGFFGSGSEGELQKHLAAATGSRPVLLVDGWDETGPLGKELREKLLVLMKHYPRLQVTVSSRPYGEARPSHGEGFDLLDIQPLSDDEIGRLSHRFFARCYGQDEATATKEVERFQRALTRAPEPQALARTALLLTMMLLISRSRPLPDKRHLLYEVCIENLLTALPKRKEEEGALLQKEQWRPDDSEECLRVVAALAFAVQSVGYRRGDRAAIVREWEEMARALPIEWPASKRMSFLGWLAGPAGLLTDRADGTLAFTHLSFQEFLTAWHLNANVEGTEPRVHQFSVRLQNDTWWETLCLWAALIERQSRGRLDPVLDALAKQEGGMSLVGTMLADGLGAEDRVDGWAEAFLKELAAGSISREGLCSRAWAGSRQEERKKRLARILTDRASRASWLGWHRFRRFFQGAGLGADLPLPQSRLSGAIISQLEGAAPIAEQEVAAGRVLCGGPPVWPIEPLDLGLLQVWPSNRRSAGVRLQLAISCGADRVAMAKLSKALMSPAIEENLQRARDLARDLAREWTNDWQGDFAPALAHDMAHDLARGWARGWAREWSRDSDPYSARYWARSWVRYWGSDSWDREWARDWARDWAYNSARERAPGRQIEQAAWLFDFSPLDISAFGRFGARAQLAYMRGKSDSQPKNILAAACQLSFYPTGDSRPFHKMLKEFSPSIDSLWPALARHLARLSTAEDRALLIDLAQHPEHRDLPLSWGLRYIVRGDVMLEDGSVLTLDELADEAGVPRLPYLDEMPDELEID